MFCQNRANGRQKSHIIISTRFASNTPRNTQSPADPDYTSSQSSSCNSHTRAPRAYRDFASLDDLYAVGVEILWEAAAQVADGI